MNETLPPEPVRNTGQSSNGIALLAVLDALSQPDFAQAAAAVASVLAKELSCTRVGVGMTRGRSTELVALSGMADTRQELELPRKIAAAMNEAVDQHVSLRYPVTAADAPHITLMQGELASAELGAALLSIPLPYQQTAIGALTLMRGIDRKWSDAELADAEQMAALIGPVLMLKQRAHEPLLTRLRHLPANTLQRLRKPGSSGVKLLALLLAFFLAFAFSLPVNDQVTAHARLEGVIQRSISAPVDSFIQDVLVRPGAQVSEGELLLTLTGQDQRFEQSRLEAELGRFRNEQAEAFARQDRSKMVGSQARVEEIAAQLALVIEKINQTRITAPFPGIVIRGDQQQQAGAPVKRGEVLMVLSPSADFRLVLQIDERDIARISAGQTGRVAFSALPDTSFPLQIQRITPVASISGGNNSFEVEAGLAGRNSALRPGLEGVAHIAMGKRPLAMIWGSRALDWLNFQLWILFG